MKPIHGYELSKALNLPLSTVYYHIRYLSNHDFIHKKQDGTTGKKLCVITEKGKKYLELIHYYKQEFE